MKHLLALAILFFSGSLTSNAQRIVIRNQESQANVIEEGGRPSQPDSTKRENPFTVSTDLGEMLFRGTLPVFLELDASDYVSFQGGVGLTYYRAGMMAWQHFPLEDESVENNFGYALYFRTKFYLVELDHRDDSWSPFVLVGAQYNRWNYDWFKQSALIEEISHGRYGFPAFVGISRWYESDVIIEGGLGFLYYMDDIKTIDHVRNRETRGGRTSATINVTFQIGVYLD